MKKPDVSRYNTKLAKMYSTTTGKREQYDQWADTYESDLVNDMGYVAPQDAANIFAGHVTDRDSRILDVACGTGLAGEYLQGHGYTQVDGADFSGEMLKIARARGVYREVWQFDVTAPAAISHAYDALICVGLFSYAVPRVSDMHNVVDCVKPGGVCIITINGAAWRDLELERSISQAAKTHGFRINDIVSAGYIENEGIDSKVLVIEK